jgi:hypothetical protein
MQKGTYSESLGGSNPGFATGKQRERKKNMYATLVIYGGH